MCNDLLKFYACFSSTSWSHVKKEGEVVAYLLAKYFSLELGERVWLGNAPDFVVDVVASDVCDIFMK